MLINNISIVITCHSKYENFLSEAIKSVEKQNFKFIDKTIVCDNMISQPNYVDWEVIHGNWGNPNSARNAGLYKSRGEWIIFLDADDRLGDNYISSLLNTHIDSDIACCYPDLKYFYDGTNQFYKKLESPEYNFWELRKYNYIDTSSTWNKYALLSVNGWTNPNSNLDDYYLIIKLSRQGWKAKKIKDSAFVEKRDYIDNSGRCKNAISSGKMKDSLWSIRNFAIVSLLAGRESIFDKWSYWILNANLPQNISLYIIDNSNNDLFYDKIINLDYSMYSNVNIYRIKDRYIKIINGGYFQKERHLHVCKLYNSVFPLINDDFILTLEDDVIPPLNGLRLLADYISLPTKIGAIGGIYPSPIDDKVATASTALDHWDSNIPLLSVYKEPIKIGFIGGGFTLWNNAAIKDILPAKVKIDSNGLKGWDNNFSLEMRQKGYDIYLHNNVKCEHWCKNNNE